MFLLKLSNIFKIFKMLVNFYKNINQIKFLIEYYNLLNFRLVSKTGVKKHHVWWSYEQKCDFEAVLEIISLNCFLVNDGMDFSDFFNTRNEHETISHNSKFAKI